MVQLHWNVPGWFTQVPPLLHGDDWHSSKSISQLGPGASKQIKCTNRLVWLLGHCYTLQSQFGIHHFSQFSPDGTTKLKWWNYHGYHSSFAIYTHKKKKKPHKHPVQIWVESFIFSDFLVSKSTFQPANLMLASVCASDVCRWTKNRFMPDYCESTTHNI